MSCDKYKQYISLHIDGKLDSVRERALRGHLSECPDCRETLAALESAEKAARSAGAKEPRAGYWDTFSGRVMQRIDAEEARREESRWAKWLPVVLPPAGRRLRFAAGVASIAFAVVVGVVFVSRQGDRAMPTQVVQAPAEREPAVEKGKDAEAPLAAAKKDVSPPAKKTEAPSPSATMQTAPPSTPKETAPSKVENEALDVAAESAREEKTSAPTPEKMERPGTVSFTMSDKRAPVTVSERSQAVGGVALRKIADNDASLTVDELRAHIAVWKTQIEASPADSLKAEGYREVAAAYCLLAKQTGNETDIEEGARVIQAYLVRTGDPELKAYLAAKLAEILVSKKK